MLRDSGAPTGHDVTKRGSQDKPWAGLSFLGPSGPAVWTFATPPDSVRSAEIAFRRRRFEPSWGSQQHLLACCAGPQSVCAEVSPRPGRKGAGRRGATLGAVHSHWYALVRRFPRRSGALSCRSRPSKPGHAARSNPPRPVPDPLQGCSFRRDG